MATLIGHARDFSLLLDVAHLRCETALDALRDRYGNITDAQAAAAVRTERNRDAVEAYTTCLLPHAEELLACARLALDEMPPARHLAGWKAVLNDLGHATGQIRRILTTLAEAGTEAAREQTESLWPYLTAWAEHGYIVTHLADQHRTPDPALTGDEQRHWTDRATAAQHSGDLDPFESWYDTQGRLITLAYLIEHDESTILAFAGDLDTPGWQVLGQYNTEYEAGQSSPPPAPSGVLRPDTSRYTPHVPTAEITLQELIQDITTSRHSGDVAEVLLRAADETGHAPGPLARTQELIAVAAEFADALETRQGQCAAARLSVIGRQLGLLTRELRAAAEELGATIGVLPPHRTPRPRFVPPSPPALTTRPPATAPPAVAPAQRR
ncbi:hypothetical protein ACWGDX_19305 [Streptomyces sp. NPDC055025]